jgi:hypothetical protein
MQSPDAKNHSRWEIAVMSLRDGRCWIVDSAQTEGISATTPPTFADGNISLSDHLLAWTTTHQAPGQPLHILVKTQDLTTQQTRIIAYLPNAGKTTAILYWTANDGRYVAWVRRNAMPPLRGDRIQLYDLRTKHLLTVPQQGQNSQPVLANGYLAWKVGSNFDVGKGVQVYHIGTNQRRSVPVANLGVADVENVQLGDRVLAYRDYATGALAFYDLQSEHVLRITADKLSLPGGWVYFGLWLGGDFAALGLANQSQQGIQPGRMVFFHLSAPDPLRSIYH